MYSDPDKGIIFQNFGDNANPSYKGVGLKGHTGEDTGEPDDKGFGTPIHSPYLMYVYKVLTKNNPARDGSGFTGVFGVVDNGIEMFEWLIGHCDPSVSQGDIIQVGEQIGTEANHGTVYADGQLITLDMQAKGDKRGTHRHNQKRPVMPVLHTTPGKMYLDLYSDMPAGTLFRDAQGHYYQIWDYNNGYHGCIDPVKSVFNRDLTVGMTGYDVYVLQRILVREGCATFEATGYFGNLTKAAMIKLQDKVGIMPDVGYFGPKTRGILQAKYNV